jgi:hypothetical protein
MTPSILLVIFCTCGRDMPVHNLDQEISFPDSSFFRGENARTLFLFGHDLSFTKPFQLIIHQLSRLKIILSQIWQPLSTNHERGKEKEIWPVSSPPLCFGFKSTRSYVSFFSLTHPYVLILCMMITDSWNTISHYSILSLSILDSWKILWNSDRRSGIVEKLTERRLPCWFVHNLTESGLPMLNFWRS